MGRGDETTLFDTYLSSVAILSAAMTTGRKRCIDLIEEPSAWLLSLPRDVIRLLIQSYLGPLEWYILRRVCHGTRSLCPATFSTRRNRDCGLPWAIHRIIQHADSPALIEWQLAGEPLTNARREDIFMLSFEHQRPQIANSYVVNPTVDWIHFMALTMITLLRERDGQEKIWLSMNCCLRSVSVARPSKVHKAFIKEAMKRFALCQLYTALHWMLVHSQFKRMLEVRSELAHADLPLGSLMVLHAHDVLPLEKSLYECYRNQVQTLLWLRYLECPVYSIQYKLSKFGFRQMHA